MPRRAGLDHAAVVEAAAQLADQQGFDALTLATVAAQLGIRTPSLYNHVAGLPGLHRALALRGIHVLTARLRAAALGRSGADAVRAIADSYRSFVKQHPGLYAATVRAPAVHDADAALHAASDELIEVVLTVLGAFGLKHDDALHAVRGLRSLVHGFATLELAGGFGLPLDTDESFGRLIDMFIAALEQDAKRGYGTKSASSPKRSSQARTDQHFAKDEA